MTTTALDSTGKLLLGLAAAVGAALLVYARKHGVEVEIEPEPPSGPPALPPGPRAAQDPAALARARAELATWAGRKDSDPSVAALLAKYWAAVGLPPQPSTTPWSAAFISYVAGAGLQPNAGHIGYTRAALKARQAGKRDRYWAFAPWEMPKIQAGDIVVRGRGAAPLATWQDVTSDTGHKDAHGDLVTQVQNGVAGVIGGNVSDGVTARAIPDDPAAPSYSAGSPRSPVFAVLRFVPEGGVA